MQRHKRPATRVKPTPDEPVEIQLMSDHFLDIFEARDISVTGVGIFVPYRFEGCNLQGNVQLVITLPGARPFMAKGRIIHRSKVEREFFGIEFCDLDVKLSARIATYVRRVLARSANERSAEEAQTLRAAVEPAAD